MSVLWDQRNHKRSDNIKTAHANDKPPIKTSEVEMIFSIVLVDLVVRLAPGAGAAVRLEVRETFIDLALVTNTGDPTAVRVTEGRHQDKDKVWHPELKIILKVEMPLYRYQIILWPMCWWCRTGPRRVCPTTDIFVGSDERESHRPS